MDRNGPEEERALERGIEKIWEEIRTAAGTVRTTTDPEIVREQGVRLGILVERMKQYTFRLEMNRMYQAILSRVDKRFAEAEENL